MRYMFAFCSNLKALDFSSIGASAVDNMGIMLRCCSSLETLDLSGISTTSGAKASNMFSGNGFGVTVGGTERLSKIVLGDGWTKAFDNACLPPVPNNETYTGKWVKIEDLAAGITDHALTSDQLMNRTNSSVKDYAGTWVWQLKTTDSYVVNLNPLGGYYDEGGHALPGSITGTVGTPIVLPTPDEYTASNGTKMHFLHWRTGYDATHNTYSGYSFEGGQSVNNVHLGLGAGTGGYVTLYAEWSSNETITGIQHIYLQNTYDAGYTCVSTTPYDFPTGNKVSVPSIPDGYSPEAFVYMANKFEYITDTGTTKPYINNDSTYTVTPTNGAKLNFYYNHTTYRIVFNKNVSSETVETTDQTMMVNVTKRLDGNPFTCEGKSFLGWNTKSDGSGTSYTDQQKVKDLAEEGQEITLYAQWASGSSQSSSTGTYSFTLKAGQKVHFINVPAGTTYTVVETDIPDGWKPTGPNEHATGTIKATSTSEAEITNTYNATGVVSLRARKTMQSGTLTEGQFSFELLDSKEHVLQTVTNQAPADGTATADILFDALEYDLSDLMNGNTYTGKRTYTYKIREVVPQNDDDGVIYGAVGQTEQEVTVEVEDAGKGKLTVTPSNITTTGTGTDTVVTVHTLFTNDYKPGNLVVSKSTTGTNEASKDAAFSFTVNLKDAQGNPVGRSYDLVHIDQNGTETKTTNGVTFSAGQATIGNIHSGESFRIEGIAQGTTYEVKETAIPNGFTPSGVEGDEGTIGAGQTSFASFTNSYQAKGSVTLTATKTLEDGDIADYTFTFQLFDDTNQLLQTKTNDAQGNVAFDAIEFTAQDAGTRAAPKEYSYKISEVNDKQMYIVYDIDSEWVTVKVWDDGSGHIHADAEWDNKGTAASFTNKLRNSFVLPATGGNGIAVPIAVSVIVATGEAARRMRRRRREE